MNARLSLLFCCALLCACGADLDPSDAPASEPPATPVVNAEQAPAQTDEPAAAQPPAADAAAPSAAPPEPPSGAAPPAESPQPATPAETTPAPTGDAQQPMFAPTPATVVRETVLRQHPSLDAETLATLPVRTAVTIVDRQEGWFAVVREDTRGWVRLLHVSSQPPGTHGPIPPELERAAQIATGRAGGGNIVVTSGTRGLTAEELRQADANLEELGRMEAQSATPAQAEAYASEHGLGRHTVPYPADGRAGGR